jgi:holliday junction DNA helicase RuvA
MIATINGEVTVIGNDHLVINVGGIGFKVFVPTEIRNQAEIGNTISLNTQLIVREDSLTLFGFSSEGERDFFILLLGVNGVGPRTALTALSTLSVDVIRRAVLSEQADVLTRIPGVGKKLAQKMLIHLQGKVGEADILAGEHYVDVNLQVLEALTSLGYSVVEAQAALQSIPKDAPKDIEERLRLALQYFSS